MIAIIDYGMGNLRSVEKAFEFLGFEAVVTDDLNVLRQADKIVLPGVGAFCDAIAQIKKTGLDREIYHAVESGKPFLGICLGLQLLFDTSYENGVHRGLGILRGDIVRLPESVMVPQIGWNSLTIHKQQPLYENLPSTAYVYFVHSYYLQTTEDIVSATTPYGGDIQIAVQKDNVFALQFHPEKSSRVGLTILKNFASLQ